MTRTPESSDYIEQNRRGYSLYVLQQRAIPHAADGLKPSGRRVLWNARSGEKFKTATLAGSAMNIHPHQMPDGATQTLAAPYGNNIPLFDGIGVFGTMLNPTAYGAPRYTSVKVSNFTKDVLFKDIEIIPMQWNYDESIEEPAHFLPLIPITLLNPQDGIAVGFASSILPRELEAIISTQIRYLEGRDLYEELPAFTPTGQWAQDYIENPDGTVTKYIFKGFVKKENATTVNIFGLPYGMSQKNILDKLEKLQESGDVINWEDNSKKSYNITVKFKKGVLRGIDGDDLLDKLGMIKTVSENLTMLDFDGKRVLKTNYLEVIEKFCDWRLSYYKPRYERLIALKEVEIQKYKDIIKAITKNIGGVAKKIKSKDELRQYLEAIGIINIEYIADLPVYRFTEDEKEKVQIKLKEAEKTLKEYKSLLKSPKKQRIMFVTELNEILHNWKRTGRYHNGYN